MKPASYGREFQSSHHITRKIEGSSSTAFFIGLEPTGATRTFSGRMETTRHLIRHIFRTRLFTKTGGKTTFCSARGIREKESVPIFEFLSGQEKETSRLVGLPLQDPK